MKAKYDPPTNTFPYKIKNRLNLMSVPRRIPIEDVSAMPVLSPTGVRRSALRGRLSDRVNDVSLPYIRYVTFYLFLFNLGCYQMGAITDLYILSKALVRPHMEYCSHIWAGAQVALLMDTRR